MPGDDDGLLRTTALIIVSGPIPTPAVGVAAVRAVGLVVGSRLWVEWASCCFGGSVGCCWVGGRFGGHMLAAGALIALPGSVALGKAVMVVQIESSADGSGAIDALRRSGVR
jgi:hypothetical protein